MNASTATGVNYDPHHKYLPWKARMRVGKERIFLGRYATRAEAEAAYHGARKVCLTRTPLRPPLTEAEQKAILATAQTHSLRATAQAHGVNKETVRRLTRKAKGAPYGLDEREPVGDELS
jgi:hypothetical protein